MRSFITKTISIYVLLLSTWFGLWYFAGDRFWWLTLLNRAALYLLVPTLLFLPFVLMQRWLVGLLMVPTLIFAFVFGPYFWPHVGASRPQPALRVMTYNILYSNTDISGVANTILRQRPDVVALQEVQPEQMVALRAALLAEYPWSEFGTEHPYGTTALFSKTPMTLTAMLDLNADRTAVVANVEAHGRRFAVIAVHLLAYNLQFVPLADVPRALSERSAMQRRQAELVIEEVERHQDVTAVVLACDCNAVDTGDAYRVLNRSMANSAASSGWVISDTPPPGTVAEHRLERLDYVLYRGSIRPAGAYVVEDAGGSDHQPVLAFFSTVP